MKVGIVWNLTDVMHPYGVHLAVNPRCSTILEDRLPCGRLATIRATNPGCWSLFRCNVHVHPRGSDEAAWTGYWRLFPDALDRSFIVRLDAADRLGEALG